MTTTEFAFWLHGYCELGGGTPTDKQWGMIKEHLNLCFEKKTKITTGDLSNSLERVVKDGQETKYCFQELISPVNVTGVFEPKSGDYTYLYSDSQKEAWRILAEHNKANGTNLVC